MMKNMRNLGVVAGTAIVVSLTLAACSGGGSATPGATPTSGASTAPAAGEASESHNDADTMFAQMMIVHHEGAIEMARTEQQGGEFADAATMADDIEAGQTAEITQMKALLGG